MEPARPAAVAAHWLRHLGHDAHPLTPAPSFEERVDYRLDEGDHERFSHYVPRDKLMEAMVNGTPVRALCGKLWVPSRDPERFPVCPQCKEIHESLPE